MADDDVLPPPLEIPWRLASTTLPFNNNQPSDETSISLFTYLPDADSFTAEFPDEQIVYIKVTTSISPATMPVLQPFPGAVQGPSIPVYHTVLDLTVRLESGQTQSVRPYFHAAAPLKRRMLQTGIVGHEVFEGEASGQFMGKTGSEMHEALNSESRTTSMGASLGVGVGVGPVSIGASGSVRTTSTDVTANRAVTQNVDTTSRQASDERRELVSHSTKVENILSLLNAKYVGTPFLRFSTNPRPLNLLSLDPSDPNLWYSQLLARRSSGIEGVQEYTAVIVVPKDTEFCINASLRRVCLFDSPPGPLTFEEPYSNTLSVWVRALDYVERAFPAGTPLVELDVDVLPALPKTEFPSPVIEGWWIVPSVGGFISPTIMAVSPNPGQIGPNSPPPVMSKVSRQQVIYKHPLEIWLDTLRDEYDRNVSRSPLERGVLLTDARSLDTCFAFAAGGLGVTNSQSSATPLAPTGILMSHVDVGGVRDSTLDSARDVRARGVEVVTRWNALDAQLANLLNHRRDFSATGSKLNDLDVVNVFVDRWATLSPADPDNIDLDTAVSALGLSADHRKMLKAAGATDLRSIARTLQAAPAAERYNERVKAMPKPDRKSKGGVAAASVGMTGAQADDIRRAIGEALGRSLEAASKG